MPLSRLNAAGEVPVGDGFGGPARADEAIEQFLLPEAAIEAVADLRQIALEVLGGDPTVRAPDDSLGIGDDSVHPREKPTGLARMERDVVCAAPSRRFPLGDLRWCSGVESPTGAGASHPGAGTESCVSVG